jgi:hypothetical protein
MGQESANSNRNMWLVDNRDRDHAATVNLLSLAHNFIIPAITSTDTMDAAYVHAQEFLTLVTDACPTYLIGTRS